MRCGFRKFVAFLALSGNAMLFASLCALRYQRLSTPFVFFAGAAGSSTPQHASHAGGGVAQENDHQAADSAEQTETLYEPSYADGLQWDGPEPPAVKAGASLEDGAKKPGETRNRPVARPSAAIRHRRVAASTFVVSAALLVFYLFHKLLSGRRGPSSDSDATPSPAPPPASPDRAPSPSPGEAGAASAPLVPAPPPPPPPPPRVVPVPRPRGMPRPPPSGCVSRWRHVPAPGKDSRLACSLSGIVCMRMPTMDEEG